jgi:hypothetical protein
MDVAPGADGLQRVDVGLENAGVAFGEAGGGAAALLDLFGAEGLARVLPVMRCLF